MNQDSGLDRSIGQWFQRRLRWLQCGNSRYPITNEDTRRHSQAITWFWGEQTPEESLCTQEHNRAGNICPCTSESMLSTYTYQLKGGWEETTSSLVDGGANGGVGGSHPSESSTRLTEWCNVSGIDDHQMTDLRSLYSQEAWVTPSTATSSWYFTSTRTIPMEQRCTLLARLEAFGNQVNDESMKLRGGTQSIDHYTWRMSASPIEDEERVSVSGTMRPFADEEYSHTYLTSWWHQTASWDPSVLDSEVKRHGQMGRKA